MKDAVLFVLVQIGLLYLYGLRSAVGKWLVAATFRASKKYLIRTEHDLELFMEYFQEAAKKDSR
jgi:hypothetical protein